jgi:hypothetical protein
MRKALRWPVSMCALAVSLALGVAGTASAASSPGSMAVAPAFGGRLYGVAAISGSDVWAVGLDGANSQIVHYNGTTWSQSQPAVGYLLGVAATSARDVWAVGGTNWFSPTVPVADHWNGSSWRRVATANPAGGGYFNAVTATSPANAWAVGLVGGGPGETAATTPLIERWNGRTWTIQKIQEPAGGGQFDGVAALSASNAWAVGWTDSTVQQTLIEHWNGHTWTRVPSPDEGTGSFLHSVTVISSDNAWAVGSFQTSKGTNSTLTLHWNGSRWSAVPSQTPGGDDSLDAVTASWTHNIWAVGIRNPALCGTGGPQCKTLIEHWDGSHWTLLASPNPPGGLNILLGISAVSRGDIFAVGTTAFESTLIIHWNGTAWS